MCICFEHVFSGERLCTPVLAANMEGELQKLCKLCEVFFTCQFGCAVKIIIGLTSRNGRRRVGVPVFAAWQMKCLLGFMTAE